MKRLTTLPVMRGASLDGVSAPKIDAVTASNTARSPMERMAVRGSTRGVRLNPRDRQTTTKTYGVSRPNEQPITPKNLPNVWHSSMGRRKDMTRTEREAFDARISAHRTRTMPTARDNARAALSDAMTREYDAVSRGDDAAAQRARADIRAARRALRNG